MDMDKKIDMIIMHSILICTMKLFDHSVTI